MLCCPTLRSFSSGSKCIRLTNPVPYLEEEDEEEKDEEEEEGEEEEEEEATL